MVNITVKSSVKKRTPKLGDPISNSIQIVHLEHWKRLSVKFSIVEMQLLLKDLEGDSGMHEGYVEMRNKLAN